MDQCTPQVFSPSHVVFLCREMLIMPRSLWITPTEDLDHILHTSVTFLETFQWNGTKLDTNRHMLVCDNEVCIRFITESRCLGRKVKSYGGGACSSENLAKEIVVMTVLQGMYDLSAFKDILVWTLQCHSDLWAVRWPLNPTKSAGSSERRDGAAWGAGTEDGELPSSPHPVLCPHVQDGFSVSCPTSFTCWNGLRGKGESRVCSLAIHMFRCILSLIQQETVEITPCASYMQSSCSLACLWTINNKHLIISSLKNKESRVRG